MLEKKVVSQCVSSDYCRGWNDAADAMPRWTSVDERLPEYWYHVLAATRFTDEGEADLEVVFYSPTRGWQKPEGVLWGRVTHWMPLPKLPKED